MGLLVNGKWVDEWYDTEETGGRFERDISRFRNWVTVDGNAPDGSDYKIPDGSAPNGQDSNVKTGKAFKAEPNRYHLYVSLACPWAHRTLIYRKLKGLEDMISLSVVHPLMHSKGWTFANSDGGVADPILNADYMYQIYTAAKPDYTGRVTVPVLWDKQTNSIVSNESSDIIRMFNSAFDQVGANRAVNFLPDALRDEIDALNNFIYPNINNGVYLSGFATTQAAYDEAVVSLFVALDKMEERLTTRRYLTGNSITEADWRFFTTLVRFDAVYVGHFKCNIKRIVDYPNLWGYLRDLYQVPGVADTVNMQHIKTHYYGSHDTINPTLIVPRGPQIDFMTVHDRERLSG